MTSQAKTQANMHPTYGSRQYYTSDVESYFGEQELRHFKKRQPLKVLSPADFEFWQKNGYVVVKNAVPREQALKTFDEMMKFANLDPNNPKQWNDFPEFPTKRHYELHVIGMIECYHHELLWQNRQAERVYGAFCDVWDTDELWVALDRINLNAPNYDERTIHPFIHWDIDSKANPIPQRVQGVLALNDNSQEQGGFQCVPSLYQEFDDWVKKQPGDRHMYVPQLSDHHQIIIPEVEAGDLIIFNGLLPHGIAANFTRDQIRAVQYLTMFPAAPSSEQVLADRISSYENLSTPTWNESLRGDPVLHESKRYEPPKLTPLGEKILGRQPWKSE